MKKLSLLLIAGLLHSGISMAQYEIKGNVGSGNAEVVLTIKKEILTQADMKNGKFLLKGKVSQPTAAHLSLKGQWEGTLVFLEKARYSVSLNPEDSSWTVGGGGEMQRLHREYIAALEESGRKRAGYITGINQAAREDNRGSVMIYRLDIRKIDSVRNDIRNNFIRQHADSPLVAYYVYDSMNDLDFEALREKYLLLGDKAKASEWGKLVTERYLKLQEIAAGSTAPEFTLNTPGGAPLSMYGVKAKIKIIDFWASWCGPCRANNPALVELYKQYKDAGLEIIGISMDSKTEPWEKAIRADGLPWLQVSSLQGWECPIAAQYLVSGIPALFVLDENNKFIAIKPTEEELKTILKDRLR